MQRGKYILAVAVALATVAGAPRSAPAAPIDINLDFSKPADQKMLTLNGGAVWMNNRLHLTDAGSQAVSAFITSPVGSISDYLATFQFEVQSVPGELPGTGPADGMMFVAQSAGADQVGDGGGALAYASGSNVFVPLSYGVEFNSYDGQGLGNGIDQTIAWDAFGVRSKHDQTAFPLGFVNAGVFTAQVLVQPDQLAVTISGGKYKLPPILVMTASGLSAGAPPAGVASGMPLFQALAAKPLYMGFTAGTGGAETIQEVLNLHIQSPAPAPAGGM